MNESVFLLADDHSLMREGLRSLFDGRDDMAVIEHSMSKGEVSAQNFIIGHSLFDIRYSHPGTLNPDGLTPETHRR
ncbi:MAG: hypothetical protein NTV22_06795 [bacterium]|nr:hypothetical protein [bacterium]